MTGVIKKYKQQQFYNINGLHLILLFLLWLFVQGAIIFYAGIKTDQEALRLVDCAETYLKTGTFNIPSFYLYATEIFLLIIKLKLSTGYWFVIAIHLCLNLVSNGFFYTWVNHVAGSKKTAFIGTALLISCVPYQAYNSYIYTESVYFSLTIIFSAVLLTTKYFTLKKIAILLPLLILLCITRPTGIFFFAAALFYVYVKQFKKTNSFLKWLIPAAGIVISFCLIDLFIKGNSGFDVVGPFQEEHITCGVSTLNIVPSKVMAKDNSLYKLATYLSINKAQFLRLAILKTKSFWGLVRPYYSTYHNLYLIAFFYPFFLLVILACIKQYKSLHPAFLFSVFVGLFYWISVIFTCDDWGNRFFLVLTPFLISSALVFFKK